MADENQNMKDKKQGQYGSGSQGTQEREQNITGSSGVQNRQGQNIERKQEGGFNQPNKMQNVNKDELDEE